MKSNFITNQIRQVKPWVNNILKIKNWSNVGKLLTGYQLLNGFSLRPLQYLHQHILYNKAGVGNVI